MKPYLVQHLLEQSCQNDPRKICIEDVNGSWTYEEIFNNSQKLAGMLESLGVKKGDHVGVFLDRSVEQVISILGIFYASCVLVIINPILRDEQISHIIQDANIKTLITSDIKAKKHIDVLHSTGVQKALVFKGKDKFGFHEELLFDGNYEKYPVFSQVSPALTDDTSHIIYTSGSTGLPKGIVISHRNTIDGAKIVSDYTGLDKNDVILGALPFNFDYGLNQLINTWYVGATMYLHQFFMPNDLLKILEEKKITVFAGMTPIWTKIFNPKLTDLSKNYDFSRLRVVTNTGGKVPVPIVKKLRALFSNARLFLMYGLTEAFRSTYLNPEEVDRRPDSIGKAVPNVEILILNSEGKMCKPNEEGELVHRGALISKGYWNNPEKTAEVFRSNPLLGEQNAHLETVVFSGDMVKQDEEGFLYYVGRKDNMIKTKGYRVSPTEVESLLLEMDGISECVAAGFETEDGIMLRVFVVTNNNSLKPEDIGIHCKKNFPFYYVPDDIVLMDRFPLTANGKIDRARIIEEYEK